MVRSELILALVVAMLACHAPASTMPNAEAETVTETAPPPERMPADLQALVDDWGAHAWPIIRGALKSGRGHLQGQVRWTDAERAQLERLRDQARADIAGADEHARPWLLVGYARTFYLFELGRDYADALLELPPEHAAWADPSAQEACMRLPESRALSQCDPVSHWRSRPLPHECGPHEFLKPGNFYASGCLSEPLNSFNRQILTVNSNAAGEFEAGFGNGGVAVFADLDDEECGSATLPLSEGGIVVGGYGQLRRMNESGVESPDFGVGGVVNVVIPEFWSDYWIGSTYRVIGLREDSLGRIVVLGSAPFDGDAGAGIALARYETDGTLDESFGGDGVVLLVKDNLADTKPRDFVIQPNGQIVVVGEHDYRFFATRLNENGNLDQTFGTDGWATHVYDRNVVSPKATSAEAVTLQDDGKITILCEIEGALGLVQLDFAGEVNFNFGDDEGDGWTYFTSEGVTFAIDLQYEASRDRHIATINTSDYPNRSVHVYAFLGH